MIYNVYRAHLFCIEFTAHDRPALFGSKLDNQQWLSRPYPPGLILPMFLSKPCMALDVGASNSKSGQPNGPKLHDDLNATTNLCWHVTTRL